MQPLLTSLLWAFFWPVKLPIWLWQHETIGKVFATLWLTCLIMIGLGFLPRQAAAIARPSATSNLAASLQSALLTRLGNTTLLAPPNSGQAATELTLTQAALVVATPVNPPPAPSTATDLPFATLAPVTITASAVFTTTPLLTPTSTPLPVRIATATQTPLSSDIEQPTTLPAVLPTVTPFHTPTPELASKPVTTPTALAPAATSATLVMQPTATAPALAATNPGGFTCVGGCSEAPDPSCAIKGNVNAKGDKIYHLPGGKNYDLTRIKPAEGDRWFCTEQEAQDAGFRAAKGY